MKHFIIRQASDPRIIGVKDGGSQARIKAEKSDSNYEKFATNFLNRNPAIYWKHLGDFPDFDVHLEDVHLEKNAKVTDFMSYYPNLFSGGKFLVSDRAIELLQRFNLSPFKLWNVKIFTGKEHISNYKLFYCPPLAYDIIDFENTFFFSGSHIRAKQLFNIPSGDRFQELKDEQLFQVEKIALTNKFDSSLDYFLTKVSIPDIFVSERLKVAIEESGLTGLNIVEAVEPNIVLVG